MILVCYRVFIMLLFKINIYLSRNDEECSLMDEEKLLTFSTCTSDEFTCRNGFCIAIEKRCDSSPDCADKGRSQS